MSKTPSRTEAARRAHAKGAACETIGKLIGDDAAVAKGREEQEAADKAKPSTRKS